MREIGFDFGKFHLHQESLKYRGEEKLLEYSVQEYQNKSLAGRVFIYESSRRLILSLF